MVYYFGTNKNSMTSTGNYINVSKDSYSLTYYVKACTKSGLCSEVNSYVANVDNTKPTITLNSSSNTCSTSHTIKATLTDNESGVIGYAVTKSTSTPSSCV